MILSNVLIPQPYPNISGTSHVPRNRPTRTRGFGVNIFKKNTQILIPNHSKN